MSLPLKFESFLQLKEVVDMCIESPSILCQPEFAFLRKLVEHYGGKVSVGKDDESTSKKEESNAPKTSEPTQENEENEESEESDLELDMTGVIEPDTDAPQKMGNPTLQPTEEEIAESYVKRSEAVSAFIEKDYGKAIKMYTEAILLNPQAALLYAKRGQVYLLMKKPNACILDCNRALELNPDSAAAHKFRGRAYHLLGNFEQAAADLRLACKFDFDEQANEWLHEVTPNARKIEEHKRKKERRAQEKLERQRQERQKKYEKISKIFEENSRGFQTEASGERPVDFLNFLRDPEILQVLLDPELVEAFNDMSKNPANIVKYQSNPKIMAVIYSFAAKHGMNIGGSGINAYQNAAAAAAAAAATLSQSAPKPSKSEDDVDLD